MINALILIHKASRCLIAERPGVQILRIRWYPIDYTHSSQPYFRALPPIESLFNGLEEKTGIQRASKVRSYNGLLVHVFGRLAAAMWLLLTKAQSA